MMRAPATLARIIFYSVVFIIGLLNLAWAVRSDNDTWYLNAGVAVVIFTLLTFKTGGHR